MCTTYLKTAASAALAAGAFTLGAGGAAQADGQLTLVAGGGLQATALIEEFFEPFSEETGTEMIHVAAFTGEQFARVRAMTNIGRVEWDIVTSTVTNFVSEADLLEPLDCSRLTNLADNAVEGACTEQGLLRNVAATSMAWSTEAFPDGGPRTWAEFWDVEAFPGKRCMMGTQPTGVMAIALMADGVPRDELYPIDIDRALASLERIKPHTSVWWTSGDQSQQTLRNGECDLAMMWSGQVIAMIKGGEPFDFTWQDAVQVSGYWSILRDAPNKDLAYEFLNYSLLRPEAHRAFFDITNYDTANRNAFVDVPEGMERLHISRPENFSRTIREDWKAMAEQMDDIRQRFTAFLTL